MSTNRIKAVGLELEGGWSPAALGAHSVKHDGSVRGLSDKFCIGEVCSPPITDEDAEFPKAEAWLREHYPQTVNDSCGLHVHVSLPNLHYSRLMNEDFNNCFLNAMEDLWSRFRSEPAFDLFRSRLDGQNQYCQKIFRPEDQLWRREAYGDRGSLPRYSQLNYCYGRHGTMECRLFPCFPKVEHAVAAMKAFTGCINNFLATCGPEKPIHATVEIETKSNHPRALAAVA